MSTTIIGRNVNNIYTQVNGTNYSILCINAEEYSFKTVIDTKYVDTLKKFIWYRLNTEDGNYFASTLNAKTRQLLPENIQNFHQVLLHRLIACVSNKPRPEGYTTVDHIDRVSLDNREANLRWATQTQQNQNTGKRTRKVGARELPQDIQGPLPKYVTWNVSTETTKAGKVLERKFFRIETHPAQKGKTWTTTKKASVNNEDKLNEARAKLVEFDALLEPEDGSRDVLFQEYQKIISVT